MNVTAFADTLVTLLVIMDPIGTAPLFVALTAAQSQTRRRVSALQAAGAAGGVIVGFAVFGRALLAALHVSVPSLTIAGGLLLLLVSLQMLRGEQADANEQGNVALVPLATPLLAGPGAIAAIMVLSGRFDDEPGRVGLLVGILVSIVAIGVTLLAADAIARWLRPALVHMLTRILGLLLAAIAVQLVVDGVTSIVAGSAA
ncbi:MAG: MarC family protein [Candidatus Dormiibacterota bacterium]